MVYKVKKYNFKRIFFNQAFLSLIGLILIVLISFPFAKNAIKQHKINQEIDDYKRQISSLQNKSLDLKKFVSYLESDQFAEEQARLSLNLKKSGEELTVIKSMPGDLASTSGTDQIFDIPGYGKDQPKPEVSNPRKWLNYFFKN
jgi:cell division protein FtsB